MPQEKTVLLTWKIPEHVRHQRSRLWYFIVIVLGALFIIYGIVTNNFLFSLIIILFAIVFGLLHMQEPSLLDFSITSTGVMLGNKEIEYQDIASFWMVMKPELKVKSLHFKTKLFSSPLISIPLEETNPDAVRSVMSNYVKEDTTEKDEPLLEALSRKFKI